MEEQSNRKPKLFKKEQKKGGRGATNVWLEMWEESNCYRSSCDKRICVYVLSMGKQY